MKKRLPKRIWIPLVCIAALPVVALLLVLTVSRPFVIRAVVLPRLSSELGASVSVDGMSVAPFSRVELRDIRVGEGERPLLAGGLVRIRYRLLDILRGRTEIDEVTVRDVTIHLTRRPDGTMNLPTTAGGGAGAHERTAHERTEKIAVTVRNVRIEGVELVYEQQAGPGQEPMLVRVADLALSTPVFGNGRTATYEIAGRVEKFSSGELDVGDGALAGTVTIAYDQSMRPHDVEMQLAMTDITGHAGAVDLDGTRLALTAKAAGDRDAWSVESADLSLAQGETSELAVKLSGTLERTPAHADLAVDVSSSGALLSAVLAALGDVGVGTPEVSYRGTVIAEGADVSQGNAAGSPASGVRFTASGELTAREVAVSSLSGSFPSPGPLSLSVSHKASFDTRTSELSITQFTMAAEESGGGSIRAGLSAPVSVRLPLSFSADTPDADISVHLDRFPASLAGLFIPDSSSGLSLRDGRIDGDATIAVRRGGDLTDAKLKLTVSNASGAVGGRDFAGLTVTAALAASAEPPGAVDVGDLSLNVAVDGKQALSLQAVGNLDRSKGGTVTLTLESLREPLLALAPENLRNMIRALDARGRVEARLAGGLKDWSANGRIDVVKLGIRQMPDERPVQLDVTAASEFTIGKHQASWKALTLTAESAGNRILALTSEGRTPIPFDRGVLTANIDVTTLDGDAVASLAGATGTEDSDAEPAQGDGGPEEEPAPPVDLGGLEATVQASVTSWSYKGLSGDASGRIAVENSQVRLEDTTVHVGKSPVAVDAVVDLSVPGYRYEGTTHIAQLGLSPVLSAFAPDIADQVSGRLSELDLSVSGQGTQPSRILDSLSGSASAALDDLELARWQRLQEVASKWDIPVLGDMNFDQVDAEVAFADGKVQVKSLAAAGANQSVSASGKVGFDGALQLGIELGLAGALREKLTDGKLFRYIGPAFEDRGDYLFIPVPITMTGMLSAPRVDVSSLFERVKDMSAKDLIGGALRLHQDRERKKEEERRREREKRKEEKEGETGTQAAQPAEAEPAEKQAGKAQAETGGADNAQEIAKDQDQDRDEAENGDEIQNDDKKDLTEEERKARRKERRRKKREEEMKEREQLKDAGEALLRGLLGGDREQ
jgi:hypothetical protein